jgi:hypothetical protein
MDGPDVVFWAWFRTPSRDIYIFLVNKLKKKERAGLQGNRRFMALGVNQRHLHFGGVDSLVNHTKKTEKKMYPSG